MYMCTTSIKNHIQIPETLPVLHQNHPRDIRMGISLTCSIVMLIDIILESFDKKK